MSDSEKDREFFASDAGAVHSESTCRRENCRNAIQVDPLIPCTGNTGPCPIISFRVLEPCCFSGLNKGKTMRDPLARLVR